MKGHFGQVVVSVLLVIGMTAACAAYAQTAQTTDSSPSTATTQINSAGNTSTQANATMQGGTLLAQAQVGAQLVAQAGGGGQLAEVVVTARRVSELLQNVPATVGVVTAATLQVEGLNNLEDLNGQVPGVNVARAGVGEVVTMRGLGNRGTGAGDVGFYEDGVFLDPLLQTMEFTLDTSRLEIDKGPQSLLYGRSSLTGAMNVVTADPTTQPMGFVEAGDGGSSAGGEGLSHERLLLSGPLTGDGTLLGRLVVLHEEREGYMYDPFNRNRGMGYNNMVGKVKLLWTPTSNLAVRLSAELMQANQPRGETLEDTPPYGNLLNQADASAAAFPIVNAALQQTLALQRQSVWETYYQLPNFDYLHTSNYTLDIRYQTPLGEISSLTNYQSATSYSQSGVDMSPLNLSEVLGYTNDKRYSEELRFSGTQGPLSYQAGLYWLDNPVYNGSPTGAPPAISGPTYPPFLYWYYGAGNFDKPSITAINPAASLTGDYNPSTLNTISEAAFIQVGYDLTQKLNFNVGARRGRDAFDGLVAGYLTAGASPVNFSTVQTLLAPFQRAATFDATTGNAVLQYRFTPEIMLYGSFGRGDAPGGLNGGTTQAAANTPFGEEDVNAYELGVKTLLDDRRMRLNVALWDYYYQGLQLSQNHEVPVPGQPGVTALTIGITNAAASYARGADVDYQFAITSSWLLSAGYSFEKALITSYTLPPLGATAGSGGNVSDAGTLLPHVAENSGNLSLTYTHPVGPGVFAATAEGQATSGYVNDWVGAAAGYHYYGFPDKGIPSGVLASPVVWQIPSGGYATYNFNASYSFNNWQFRVYVDNVFNKQYFQEQIGRAVDGQDSAIPGAPRTWEFTLQRKF